MPPIITKPILQFLNRKPVTIFSCVLALGLSSFLSYKLGHFKGSTKITTNTYPLIDYSRNFIPQSDFLVNLQPLRERLGALYEEYGKLNISLYIEFVNTGANISYNPDARYYPASLIKLPVAIAAVKKIEDGEWNWDSELVLFQGDVEERFGDLHKEPLGTRFSIEKLLEEMLINSDNTAHLILLRNVGAGEITNYLTNTGLEDLFDSNSNITAKEYTRIFRSLYTSSYLKRESSQKLLQLLSQVEDDKFLDRGLPDNVTFAHKFGENVKEYIYADSGIVYLPNRPYIITVLYKGDGTETKDKINTVFENISKTTYDYFANN